MTRAQRTGRRQPAGTASPPDQQADQEPPPRPISILDKVTCQAPHCDLLVCTNLGGDHTVHYLEPHQTARLVHPDYNDGPFQVTAYDTRGVAHDAVRP